LAGRTARRHLRFGMSPASRADASRALALARKLKQTGSAQSAVRVLEDYVGRNEGELQDARIFAALGYLYAELDRHDEAQKMYERAEGIQLSGKMSPEDTLQLLRPRGDKKTLRGLADRLSGPKAAPTLEAEAPREETTRGEGRLSSGLGAMSTLRGDSHELWRDVEGAGSGGHYSQPRRVDRQLRRLWLLRRLGEAALGEGNVAS